MATEFLRGLVIQLAGVNVLVSLVDPDMIVHHEHPECSMQGPHTIAECSLFSTPATPEAGPLAALLRQWADGELAGTTVNRESHLGYIAANEIERLLAARPEGPGLREEHEYLRGLMVRLAKAIGHDDAFVFEMTTPDDMTPGERLVAEIEKRLAARPEGPGLREAVLRCIVDFERLAKEYRSRDGISRIGDMMSYTLDVCVDRLSRALAQEENKP